MKLLRLIAAGVLLVAASGPGFAADPVFPPGGRVGMTPLVGLVPAKTFVGFETEDQSVKVLVAELPPEAYGEVMNAFRANPAGSVILRRSSPASLCARAGSENSTAATR